VVGASPAAQRWRGNHQVVTPPPRTEAWRAAQRPLVPRWMRSKRTPPANELMAEPVHGEGLGECGVEVSAKQAGELVWLVLLH
jgi:hypothetical protein